MCGDVKGIYVAELKINQGHNYFIKCNKNKYIITKFWSTKVMSTWPIV